MSFGPTNTTKTGQNNLGGISSTLTNTLQPQETAAGSSALNTGSNLFSSSIPAVQTALAGAQPGQNYLNTLLGGNSANTTAALQPNIQQIQQGTTNTLNGVNTLTPRGGGRAAADYGLAYAPQGQIQNLFNSARTSAASAAPSLALQTANTASILPQLGLGEQGVGSNLFGLGNQALGTAAGASGTLTQSGLQQQQLSNQLASGLGGGLFGLLTAPLSGGTSLLSKLFSSSNPVASV